MRDVVPNWGTPVSPLRGFVLQANRVPPLPLHIVQGKRGGLRCFVPDGTALSRSELFPDNGRKTRTLYENRKGCGTHQKHCARKAVPPTNCNVGQNREIRGSGRRFRWNYG